MCIKKNVILLMCDSIQRYKFMVRLANPLGKENVMIVTSEPLVKLRCFFSGIKCCYVFGKTVPTKSAPENSLESIEYLNGTISLEQCKSDSIAAIDILSNLFTIHKIHKVVIWNGQQLLGRVLADVAKDFKCNTVFLELSNLNGKLFADPQGVNALSSIAYNDRKLSSLDPIGEEKHQEWIYKYKKFKEKPIPQSKNNKVDQLESVLNRCLKFVFKGVGLRTISGKELINKSVNLLDGLEYDQVGTKDKFVFLPLQVSTDTQLKLHSDYNNIRAIEYSALKANESGVDLVIKLHPAENNQDEIKKIIDLKSALGFKISNQNTIDLIKNSNLVITINSTVGLEALIFNKELVVLGRALYKSFNQALLKKYIHRYLIDEVDFFDGKKITVKKAKELLSYAS